MPTEGVFTNDLRDELINNKCDLIVHSWKDLPIEVGNKTKIAAILLVVFCIATAFIFHADFSNQVQINSFLKNIALAGGFIFIAINGPKKFSLDNKNKK